MLVNLEYAEHVEKAGEKAAGLAEVLLSPKAGFPWTMDQQSVVSIYSRMIMIIDIILRAEYSSSILGVGGQ